MSIISTYKYCDVIRTCTQPSEVGSSECGAIQAQIEREYKIRDGASRLLQASKTSRQSMEASKSLFVSNAKIISLMKELQQRQSGMAGKMTRYVIRLSSLSLSLPLLFPF